MLTNTSVIVLNYIKYSDSSIIVHGISEQYGRISFLVHGIGSKKSRSKLVSFQPLYIIDAQLYFKTNRNIQKLKEHRLSPPLFTLTADIRKSSLSLFMGELLSKTVKEEYVDKNLFEFIKASILILDELDKDLAIFHLVFLLKLSRFLGFAPANNSVSGKFFDYKEGVLVLEKPYHEYYILEGDYRLLLKLTNADLAHLGLVEITQKQRDYLMDVILKMYEIHILDFTSLNSYQVLKEVFG